MEIISSSLAREDFAKKFMNYFENLVKGVVDLERGIMAVDAELHSDLESLLVESGSKQENLWGVNLYPGRNKDDFVEFTSLINIRPHQGNVSMGIEDEEIRKRVQSIIERLVKHET